MYQVSMKLLLLIYEFKIMIASKLTETTKLDQAD